MQQLYKRCEPSIVFHGTSSCYCDVIERQGFPVLWRPFKREDINFLLSLGEECNLHHIQSIYLDINYNVQDPNRQLGAYFTHILEGAVQYAGYTGGETIRSAFNRAGFLYENLKTIPGRKAEILKLRSLKSKWRSPIEDSQPVVYAIRATEREFPKIIPSQTVRSNINCASSERFAFATAISEMRQTFLQVQFLQKPSSNANHSSGRATAQIVARYKSGALRADLTFSRRWALRSR